MISSSVVFGLELVDEFSLFEGGGEYGNLFFVTCKQTRTIS